MKIAIHHRSGSFSDRWIEYCKENFLDFETVNCYAPDILEQLKQHDCLLWHWHHQNASDQLFARQLIQCVEKMGIPVYPNYSSCWHYDDKLSQKYLLESIEAPAIPAYVFFSKAEAIKWIETARFPTVFKLRCGAGSKNVRLVKTKSEALRLCEKAFGSGFQPIGGYFRDGKTKATKISGLNDFAAKLKRMPGVLRSLTYKKKSLPRQRDYLYFQDFLPGNDGDYRVVIIGKRAFALKRMNRPNDFRASGSGKLEYARQDLDPRMLEIAFMVSKKLNAQSMAYDFLYDQDKEPKIAEISFAFPARSFLNKAPGYWDIDLNWHDGTFYTEDLILEYLLDCIEPAPETNATTMVDASEHTLDH